MAKSSLNQVVSKLADTGKSKIGYSTAKQYENILEALKYNKEVITIRTRRASSATASVDTSMQHITYSGIRTEDWADAIADADGFLTDKNGKLLYQGLINTKCYGSFVAEGDLNSDGFKKFCINSKEDDIISLMGDVGLPNELTIVNVESCAKKNGGKTPFKIGVALNFNKFVMPFFNKFFSEKTWDEGQLRTMASEGKMYAEISVATSAGSKNANVIHAMVTNESTSQVQGTAAVGENDEFVSSQNLVIPYSLLLLNDYSALGTVTLQINGKGQKVNFPFATSHYNHLTGEIIGFNPDWITTYCSDGQGGLNLFDNSLVSCDVIGTNRARVRLYLARNAASGLPDNEQLYRGQYSVGQTKVTQMGGVISGALPNGSFRVIIDVGHSDRDPGAVIKTMEYDLFGHKTEYKLNQMAAGELKKYLEEKGVGVTLLDTPGNQSDNTTTYNFVGSNKDNYACMVSIHHNDAVQATGSEVLISRDAKDGDLSWKLGQKLAVALNNVIKGRNKLKPIRPIDTGRDKFKIDDIKVLSNSHLMPCALPEIGFLSKRDTDTIRNVGYAKIAQYMGNAIIQWYNENKSN